MLRISHALAALVLGASFAPFHASAGEPRIYAVPKYPAPAAAPRRIVRTPAAAMPAVPRPPSNFMADDTILGSRFALPRFGAHYPYGRDGYASPRFTNRIELGFPPRAGAPVVSTQRQSVRVEQATAPRGWALRGSMMPDLSALGMAAAGNGPGAAELRELIGAIVARRDRQWQERLSGARVVQVDEYQLDIDRERRAIRRLENRERNPHILYLGFDD